MAVTLPGPVRDRALALAADALGALPAGEVPARLKAVARFAPARRAKLGAAPLATALDSDPAFLARVAEVARSRSPELAAELEAGSAPAAADPTEVAVLAYLLRVPGWPARVAAAATALDSSTRSGRAAEQEVVRLRAQLGGGPCARQGRAGRPAPADGAGPRRGGWSATGGRGCPARRRGRRVAGAGRRRHGHDSSGGGRPSGHRRRERVTAPARTVRGARAGCRGRQAGGPAGAFGGGRTAASSPGHPRRRRHGAAS